MDKEDIAALNRARVTAGWSYLGALIPLIGFILGGISLSNLSAIESPISEKALRRIRGVRKMAYGGLSLSFAVAVIYGSTTYITINNNNKALAEEAKNKLARDISECKEKIRNLNSKIHEYNSQFTTPKNVAYASFSDNITGEVECEKDNAGAISSAKAAYNRALTAVNTRCLDSADQNNERLLIANATSTRKDANGQTIYTSSQANMDRIQQIYQSDKDSCS